MKKTFRSCRVFLIVGAAAVTGAAANDGDRHGTKNIFGTDYPNACSAPQRQSWQRTLKQTTGDTKTLPEAVALILCAPRTPANKARVRKMMVTRVHIETEDTGSEPELKVVAPDDDIVGSVLAGGEAWNVTVDAGAMSVVLQYYPNEACIKSLTLNKNGRHWTIEAISEACD